MKKFFQQDKIIVGIVAGLGSELLLALLLTVGLIATGNWPPNESQIRWYAGVMVAPLLLVRYYSKQKQWLNVTRTLIVVLFVTSVAIIYYLLHYNIIVYK